MTGRGDLTLAYLSASLMAIVTTMLLNDQPYETLKHRMLDRQALIKQNVTAFKDGVVPH